MTIRLYHQDVYLKHCTAEIRSITRTDAGTALILDRTICFPEGGGQSSDRAKITHQGDSSPAADITDVQEKDGEILHYLSSADGRDDFREGETVELTLDWEHRFCMMQRHAGEHILSGAFHRLFGAFNKGFHMGEDAMTIDLEFNAEGETSRMVDLTAYPDYERVTWKMAMEAEREANRVIWEDAPIQVSYFASREEADSMPLRKTLNFNEDISVVTMGTDDHPLDCCPCCGTHPSSTGQVGLIKIYKIEPSRGKSRIYFDAGMMALKRMDEQANLLFDIGDLMSAGETDLLEKMKARISKEDGLHDRLFRLTRQIIAQEEEKLKKMMKTGLVARYKDLSVDDLLRLQKRLKSSVTGILFLVQEDEHVVLLTSDGREENDCSRVVTELARPLGGRGGGKPQSARVSFVEEEAMNRFLSEAAEAQS